MPVPTHFKVQIRGDFLNTPEHWSTGFHLQRAVPTAPDAGLGDVNEGDLAAAFIAFFSTVYFFVNLQATDFRVYPIGTDGKMQGNEPMLHEFAPGECKGTNSNALWPLQVAMAVTLVADDKGPAHFGRMFLPGVSQGLGSDARWTDATCSTYAESVTQLLKSASDAVDLPLTISAAAVNVSKGPAGSGTGTLQLIDHVEVGRVPDTIRNRRKSLLEERHVHGQIDW